MVGLHLKKKGKVSVCVCVCVKTTNWVELPLNPQSSVVQLLGYDPMDRKKTLCQHCVSRWHP